MGTLFADPRIEALYRRLFDTPERRARLAELLGALLEEAPPPAAQTPPRKPRPAKNVLPPPDLSSPPIGDGERLDASRGWLEVSFAADQGRVESVMVFETHRPGALYAVVAVEADGRTETLWQRGSIGSLPHAATVLSVRLREPRPLTKLRLWVDTDVVDTWPEIDTVALVPWRITTETCAV